MKKITFLLLLAWACLPVFAQITPPSGDQVEVELSAEKNLETALTDYFISEEEGYGGIQSLIISGPMTSGDFAVIRKIPELMKADLYFTTLPNNKLPNNAFTTITPDGESIGMRSLMQVDLPPTLLEIGSGAFNDCRSLVSVYINDSKDLTTIGSDAFKLCISLIELNLPASCKSFDRTAITGCSSLNSLTVDNANEIYEAVDNAVYTKENHTLYIYPVGSSARKLEVKKGTFAIGTMSFFRQEHLEELVLPESLVTIEEDAFLNAEKLAKVNFPANLINFGDRAFTQSGIKSADLSKTKIELIGAGAFLDCKSLTEVSLPTTLTLLEDLVFKYCVSLKTVNMTGVNQLNQIGTGTFQGCAELTAVDYSACSLDSVEQYAFTGCKSLTAVNLPQTVKHISESAFDGCEVLKMNGLPTSLVSIGANAFRDNKAMNSLHISDKIEIIENGAFSNCVNIAEVTVDVNNLNYKESQGIIFNKSGDEIVFAPCNSPLEILNLEDIVTLSDYAFAGSKNLKKVVLPFTLKYLGRNAFADCESLEEVDLSACDQLTNIGESAFQNTKKLKTFKMVPDNNDINLKLGVNAMKGCVALETITLPSQISAVVLGWFDDCTSLKSADLSKISASYIATIFKNCPLLTEVKFSDKVTSLGVSFFEGCTSITSLNLPVSLSSLDGRIFSGSSIASFTVPAENVTYSAKDGVIYSKDGKKLIVYPLKKAGDYVIPEGTTAVGVRSFLNCTELTKLTIPTTVGAPAYDNILNSFINLPALTAYEVASGHTNLAVENGALYDFNKTTLYAYPGGKEDAVELAATTEVIDEQAFAFNQLITSLEFKAPLKEVKQMGVLGLPNLTSIDLPNTVTKVNGAFENCAKLRTIICRAEIVPTANNYTFRGIDNLCIIYVPDASLELYQAAKYWNTYDVRAISTVGNEIVNKDEEEMNVYVENGTLTISSTKEVSSVVVYSMSGQVIARSNQSVVELNSTAKELIIVNIRFNDGTTVVKKAMKN